MEKSEKDFSSEVSKEKKRANPKVRTVIGFKEGYAEGSKRRLIEQINKGVFASREEILQEVDKVFGSDEDVEKILKGIRRVVDLKGLPEALSSINLTVKHSLEEVQKLLVGSKWKVKEAFIYSVFNASIYSKPAVVITGNPQTEEIPFDFLD